METVNLDVLAPIIAQLGVASIFVWLWIKKDREKDELATRKDAEKDALVSTLIESYNANTRVQSEVKSSILSNTEAMKSNRTLTEKIYEELLKNGYN